MEIYPRIEIDINKIKHNTQVLVGLAKESNINITGITKVFCGLKEIAHAMVAGGVTMLGDSRVENIKKLESIDIKKLFLRLPMISQAMEIVKYTDISLNSEISTIKALGEAALKLNKVHSIILMIDLGDLREGVLIKDALKTVEAILKIEGIKLIGLGTNLTCYGGVIPQKDNLEILVDINKKIESKFNISLSIVSGGNSSSLYLLEKKEIPSRINNLRLGEAIVLGRETAFGNRISNTYEDAFILKAEIIELKEKPSVPTGTLGVNAFGEKPNFEDKGIRKRAILAIGRQDISVEDIAPKDSKVGIIGASSDHLIVDITDCSHKYTVGDKLDFTINYGSLLKIMSSEYVYKKFIK